jgi:hypothetical protein
MTYTKAEIQEKIEEIKTENHSLQDLRPKQRAGKQQCKNKANVEREKKFDELTPKNKNDAPEEIKLPFHVLGYTPERKILIWHKKHLMSFSVSQLRTDELGLLTDFQPDGVKEKIIKEAREKGVIDEADPIRMGIWFIKGKWLIVSGKTALEVSEDIITEIENPVYEGKIIKFSKSWLNIKKFKDKHGKASLKAVYKKIYAYISQWCWKEKDAAKYLSALVLVIAFQQAMKWRPWVYLSGETGTGKSLFLDEVIGSLFNELVKRADKTTEHAIYQAVGNTSRILNLDEFEKSKHIPQVMEALKLMSRGGEKTTGTPGEKELTYLLHHIPILASIYTPATCVKDESQRNRLMRFELIKPKDRTPPTIWTDEEAEDILAELIAAVMEGWEAIQKQADVIVAKTKQIKASFAGNVDDRTIQNFMYVSAVLEVVTGEEHTVPDWAATEKKSDGHSVIETIVLSKIRHENKEYLITDLIDAVLRRPSSIGNNLDESEAKDLLRLHGLTTVFNKDIGGWRLAVKPDSVTKNLLKGDEYKGMDITLPLERIPGAESKKTNFGGNSSLAAIQIPMSVIDELRGYIAMPQ